MLVSGGIRRLGRVLRRVPALHGLDREVPNHLLETTGAPISYAQFSRPRSLSSSPFGESANTVCSMVTTQKWGSSPLVCAHFSTEANEENAALPETAHEVYQKMLKSVEAKTMPPNAWLWSLIEKCTSEEDIKLLFQILHRLRVFRLANLRIHANFNCHLCLKVTEACVRSNALEYGMKALWKHNIYGLTPTVSSAHRLLLHAKVHSDVRLMEKIMDLVKKNKLPLQPGTADIVFSICYDTKSWKLMLKYAERFLKAGVKIHQTAYDNLMDFAAKRGNTKLIWKIEEHRSKHLRRHTLATGFACAKAYLIERNPESAAAIISLLYQGLPDAKKPCITDELQKLVSEWPSELFKRKKEKDEALLSSLQNDIQAMVASLLNLGIDATVNLGALNC